MSVELFCHDCVCVTFHEQISYHTADCNQCGQSRYTMDYLRELAGENTAECPACEGNPMQAGVECAVCQGLGRLATVATTGRVESDFDDETE
mgnify:CR=1 FL=1